MNFISKYFFGDFFQDPETMDMKTRDSLEKSETTQPIDAKTIAKFYGKDLLSSLGQGPIKKNPIRKNKSNREEENSPEMEAEIKKLFGEQIM